MRGLLLLLICLAQTAFAQPDTAGDKHTLVLASQRNAGTIADAVRLFSANHPDLRVIARSDRHGETP